MPDFTKLPKWAQQEIADRDRRIIDLKRDVEMLKQENPPSSIYYAHYGSENVFIPDGARVRFNVGKKWDDFIEVYRGDKGISVYAGSPIYVIPHVTNIIHIELRKD